MTKTQGALITSIRDRLDETIPTFWSDAQICRWINEALLDVARRTETIQDRDDVSVSAGTREYSLPTDCLRVYRVEFRATGASEAYPLEFRQFNAMDAIWGTSQEITTGMPVLYTIWGYSPSNKIVLYPVPAVAGSIKVFNYRLPAELATNGSAASTTVEIPNGWESLIVDYAEYSALRRDRDPRWQEAKQLYEQHLQELWELSRTWSDQGNVITPEAGIGIPAWLVYDGYSY